MINLLLPKNIKLVRQEYQLRLACTYGLALVILLIITLVASASILGAILIENRSLGSTLSIKKNGGTGTSDNNVKLIADTNKKISRLNTDSSLYLASNLIDRAVAPKPAGIKLKTIEVKPKDDGKWQMSLMGISVKRNDLVQYIAELKKDQLFLEINSPFSNLIKESNSDFTVVITLDPQKYGK